MANNQDIQSHASRAVAIKLFAKAVGMCVAYPKRQSIRRAYRQLEWTVLQHGGYGLPSESTFRRAVRGEHERRYGNPQEASRAVTLSEVEDALIRKLVDNTIVKGPRRPGGIAT